MRNPMMKRITRELKHDLGKYLAIFLFLILFIGMVSGFLVTTASCIQSYNDGFTDKKIEDGHFSFTKEAPQEILDLLSEKGEVTIYPYFYFEEEIKNTEKNIRVYSTQRELNYLSLLRGKMPVSADEIALDRMFAENNDIKVGDKIILKDKELTVSGYIASPDYGCLFENNSDMMFDSINFSVGVMTEEGFEQFDSEHITYNYSYLFSEFVKRSDEKKAKQMSDEFIAVFEDVMTEYVMEHAMEFTTEHAMEHATEFTTEHAMKDATEDAMKNATEHKGEIPVLNDFLPRYLNQAINFVGEDMGSDRAMMIIFDYILTIVLAFVFAITVSNTITTEASVIGTLRASGYTRGELLSHYIILPVFVTFLAAIIGNILGYTVFTGVFVDMYYGSYSLTNYRPFWNAEAFMLTTLIPIGIMFVINVLVIWNKLKLSPLKLIRRDLSKDKHKKAIRLPKKISFLNRFRFRIILQNVPGYITMFSGILLGGILVVFGTMFKPLLADYKELIVNDRICDYQYVLTQPIETADEQAEKYALTSLKTTDKRFMEDEISVFGIEENSAYVAADIADDRIAVSNGIAEKFGLQEGDTLSLKDPYNDAVKYDFAIGAIYEYHSSMAVFMTRADYSKKFGESPDYFTGYFSNTKLSDIDDGKVATIITVSDMTKASNQLTVSLGDMMDLMKWLGVIVFALLMFIMSKQIIEKNSNSISMTKILGFTGREIGRLYIIATSIVVVLSLLLAIPLIGISLKTIFEQMLYKMMTGYIPFAISESSYLQLFLLGIGSYALIAVLQMRKINRIPKSDALKNVE